MTRRMFGSNDEAGYMDNQRLSWLLDETNRMNEMDGKKVRTGLCCDDDDSRCCCRRVVYGCCSPASIWFRT